MNETPITLEKEKVKELQVKELQVKVNQRWNKEQGTRYVE